MRCRFVTEEASTAHCLSFSKSPSSNVRIGTTSFPGHRDFCVPFPLQYFSSLSNSSWVLKVRKNRHTHVHGDHRQGHTTHTKAVRPQKLMAFLSSFLQDCAEGLSIYFFQHACSIHFWPPSFSPPCPWSHLALFFATTYGCQNH
jgi:hypothetical protein